MAYQAHVQDYKKESVKAVAKLMKENPIIGLLNVEGLASGAFQKMRQKLRKDVYMTMTKKRLILRAIDLVSKEKPGLENLKDKIAGMPALLFSKENPFRLNRIIDKNKSPAPAKAGQKAPKDIVIPAGPTPFAPGPILSELNQVGIKAAIEGGKVVVRVDSTVVKEGAVISDKVAAMLGKFNINPMEVGLDLVCVYEGGLIYDRSVLAIDEKAFMEKLLTAARWSVNLSVEAAYPTKDTIKILLGKAFRETRALAVDQGIAEPGVMPDVLARAYAQMLALKNRTGM
jgi:large subunit ribosomal protein L10